MRHGVEHPAVNGVFFEPVTHSGRHVDFDPLPRLVDVEDYDRQNAPPGQATPA